MVIFQESILYNRQNKMYTNINQIVH